MIAETPGGGGWGDPFDRDPDLVLRDVQDGVVSPEAARNDYGVVVTQSLQAVDVVATEVVAEDETSARASYGRLRGRTVGGNNADYQIVECAPELADTAQFCEHYGYRLDESISAILVVGKGEPRLYALCVVLATTQVDVNKHVRQN